MNNMMSYLDWRGDLTFKHDPLNEVDALIFSVLAYFNYEGIVPQPWQEGSIALAEVGTRAENLKGNQAKSRHAIFAQGIQDLLASASRVPRFRDVRLSHYTNMIDPQRSKQFSAILFSLPGRQHFIAYRGTDGTVAGWKEDFQMSFMDKIPAQSMAASYTGNILVKETGTFYLGGHSKGGNLAVSAACSLPKHLQERVIWVINNDGPGFLESVTQSKGYQRILPRVRTYIPESSIAGMLLEHSEQYIAIKSSEKLMLQHDPFSWYVEGPRFIMEQGLSEDSSKFNKYIRVWLEKIPYDQREEFINSVFDVIQSTGITRFDQLTNDKLEKIKAVINSIKGMDPEEKKNVVMTIEIFFIENGGNIKNDIRKKISLGNGRTPNKA
jgi:hypothetical protein